MLSLPNGDEAKPYRVVVGAFHGNIHSSKASQQLAWLLFTKLCPAELPPQLTNSHKVAAAGRLAEEVFYETLEWQQTSKNGPAQHHCISRAAGNCIGSKTRLGPGTELRGFLKEVCQVCQLP
jgi:hypothetical protein